MIINSEMFKKPKGGKDLLDEIKAIKEAKEKKASKAPPLDNKTKPVFFNPAKKENAVTLLINALNDVCQQLKASQQIDLDYDLLLDLLFEVQTPLDQLFFVAIARIKSADLEIIKSNLEKILAEEDLINKVVEPENYDCRNILAKLCLLTKRATPACLLESEQEESKSCIIS